MKITRCLSPKLCWFFFYIAVCTIFAKQVYAGTIILVDEDGSLEAKLSEALAVVKPGDIIQLPQGRFPIYNELALTVREVEIRGSTKGETSLDFTLQKRGAQGLLVRANNVVLKDFSILNPLGDGVVFRGVRRAHVESVNVSWTNDRLASAGGYGIYPVLSKNITIIKSKVFGAREAGIYIGQTNTAVVRDCQVTNSTVGIDIENSINVVVEHNAVKNNSIGIAVSARPHVLQKVSSGVVVKGNYIIDNNRMNNAPAHSLVSSLGSGFGIAVVASDSVLLENNKLLDNLGANINVLSYSSLNRETREDPLFDEYIENLKVVNNVFKHSRMERASVEKQWQQTKGVDVQWDGIEKSVRNRKLDSLCIQQKKKISYINRANQKHAKKMSFRKYKCNI